MAVNVTEMEVQQSSPLNTPTKKLSSPSTKVVNLDSVRPRSTTNLHESRAWQSSPLNGSRQAMASQPIDPLGHASTSPKPQQRRSPSSESSSCMPTSQSSEPSIHSARPSKTTNVVPSPAKLQASDSLAKTSASQSVGPMERNGTGSQLTELLNGLGPGMSFSSLELSDTGLTMAFADEVPSSVSHLA